MKMRCNLSAFKLAVYSQGCLTFTQSYNAESKFWINEIMQQRILVSRFNNSGVVLFIVRVLSSRDRIIAPLHLRIRIYVLHILGRR